MRPSGTYYELESLGLQRHQIEKIMTRLPKESIPTFIENWKFEKAKMDNKYDKRTTMRASMPESYQPRPVPEFSAQRSSEAMDRDYQQYTQNRNSIQENSELMAVRFFGEPPEGGYTKSYLTKKYRELALMFHPDKQNGDNTMFSMVRDSYEHLSRSIPESHSALNTDVYERNNRIIHEAQAPPKKMFASGSSFDTNLFNEFYTKNALKDPNQEGGYGSWLTSNETQETQKTQRPTKENFNDAFEQDRKTHVKRNALVQAHGPPSQHDNSCSFAVLGQGKIDDYSGSTPTVSYSDLKKAHETPHLLYDTTQKHQESNMGQAFDHALQQNKSRPTQLTSQEQEELNRRQDVTREEDEYRQYRLRQFDEDIAYHFQKVGYQQIKDF